MTIVKDIVPQPLSDTAAIYRDNPGASFENHASRFTNFCLWAEANDHNPVEYLLPQIRVNTQVEPFLYEKRFAEQNFPPPSIEQIEAFAPWHYLVEFGAVRTRLYRAKPDWWFHRYRASMLVGLAAEIAGDAKSRLSVLDVACHCGVFSLEFAAHGFGSVRGRDLREENIAQARFLARTFDISNASFGVANARDLDKEEPADIVFCAGLLYHVTFPMELFENIFAQTREFAIIDSLSQKHPFSGFHLVCSKDTSRSLEGDTSYELMPTYRAMIDALHAVGFQEVYEILGDRAEEILLYRDHNVRSFIAVKNRDGLFRRFRDGMAARG